MILDRAFRLEAKRQVSEPSLASDGERRMPVAAADVRDLIDFPIERARLRIVIYATPLFLASMITFGWTMDRHVSLVGPLFAQFGIGK